MWWDAAPGLIDFARSSPADCKGMVRKAHRVRLFCARAVLQRKAPGICRKRPSAGPSIEIFRMPLFVVRPSAVVLRAGILFCVVGAIASPSAWAQSAASDAAKPATEQSATAPADKPADPQPKPAAAEEAKPGEAEAKPQAPDTPAIRSEERRVGKECRS